MPEGQIYIKTEKRQNKSGGVVYQMGGGESLPTPKGGGCKSITRR